MLILSGGQALSVFRTVKLLNKLNKVIGTVKNVEAFYSYFVNLKAPLSEAELATLKTLVGSINQPDRAQSFCQFWVVPRSGSRSPWSSKATEVAINCGLSKIHRIERGLNYRFFGPHLDTLQAEQWHAIRPLLCDPMTQQLFDKTPVVEQMFVAQPAPPLTSIAIMQEGSLALEQANQRLGLGLPAQELAYLLQSFQELGRDPTDAELMMFAQVNSEHCRHKIFNADWTIDSVPQKLTLFDMIRNTYQVSPEGVLSAYSDNAAVLSGATGARFYADAHSGLYAEREEAIDIVIKVETHNHPTAISPFPGAATGSGGEIRDEGATGRGGKPKAGLCGFSVSHLRLETLPQPWETQPIGKPARIASALDIMLEGPIGAAAFNNEFGRPNLLGYFRTFEMAVPNQPLQARGYHKPIMIAGGLGNICRSHVHKRSIPAHGLIIQIGGPGMLIGLGGGAASSVDSGQSDAQLDYASVQRDNPEMQRRCQEVIDRCWQLGERNPILSIHDIGAGGLSNGVPEIIADCSRGGQFNLRAIPIDDPSLSPMAVWCNESQERYVLAIDPVDLDEFEAICLRERCPFAVIGHARQTQHLTVTDGPSSQPPVDLPMSVLFGKAPKMLRDVSHVQNHYPALVTDKILLNEALEAVLQFPAVASKSFLITIGDRSITGLVARDQMVGPWQVPVADVAVTLADYRGHQGEAIAVGERTPLALLDSAAAAAMAVGEAITNIAAASIESLSQVRLSANWMAAAGQPGEDAALYDAVKRVGLELCPELGISIPVGKDSLSMRTQWHSNGESKQVTAPVSLIVSAFAPVVDARRTLTPELDLTLPDTLLVLIDLAAGEQRLGGSILSQIYNQLGGECPDLNCAAGLKLFFNAIQSLNQAGVLLAYHDRSDGGLWACVCEMAFASQSGLDLDLYGLGEDPIAALLNEELGAVVQIKAQDLDQLKAAFSAREQIRLQVIGQPHAQHTIRVRVQERLLYECAQTELYDLWHLTSFHIQQLRDHPDCAAQERDRLHDREAARLLARTTFNLDENLIAPYLTLNTRPRIAVLREQGVNGQTEMAAAFFQAGFDAVDVHMTDVQQGRQQLKNFQGLVACGGFSYGDVLGAGGGWAKSILFNSRLRDQFAEFFHRQDSFALGVCNGCQMMSQLKELIPGAQAWPRFVRNQSEQFEARLVSVEVMSCSSLFFAGMHHSVIPVVVAHGEGQIQFESGNLLTPAQQALRYVTGTGEVASQYPANPNGSANGLTGFSNLDGRFTIMMPHPERVFRAVQFSWRPRQWQQRSPWMRLFENARQWIN